MLNRLKEMSRELELSGITKYEKCIYIEYLDETKSYIGNLYEENSMGNGNYFPVIKAEELAKYINENNSSDIIYHYRYFNYAIELILDDGDIEEIYIYLHYKKQYDEKTEQEIMREIFKYLSMNFEDEKAKEKFMDKYNLH